MSRSIAILGAALCGLAYLALCGCASAPDNGAAPDYYPTDALRRGEEGVTVVKVCVTKGKVTSVTLVSSSGHEDLDRVTMSNMRTNELSEKFLAHPPPGADPSSWCKKHQDYIRDRRGPAHWLDEAVGERVVT